MLLAPEAAPGGGLVPFTSMLFAPEAVKDGFAPLGFPGLYSSTLAALPPLSLFGE